MRFKPLLNINLLEKTNEGMLAAPNCTVKRQIKCSCTRNYNMHTLHQLQIQAPQLKCHFPRKLNNTPTVSYMYVCLYTLYLESDKSSLQVPKRKKLPHILLHNALHRRVLQLGREMIKFIGGNLKCSSCSIQHIRNVIQVVDKHLSHFYLTTTLKL